MALASRGRAAEARRASPRCTEGELERARRADGRLGSRVPSAARGDASRRGRGARLAADAPHARSAPAASPSSGRGGARRRRRRRLVLLLDVSGLDVRLLARAALFARAALRAGPALGGVLLRHGLTRRDAGARAADPDEALRRAAEEVADWDGGTRIGDTLRASSTATTTRSRAAPSSSSARTASKSASPKLLAAQMARLSRLAHRVVWLNPLKADPAYEPLARGMHAALPYVDVSSAATTSRAWRRSGRRFSNRESGGRPSPYGRVVELLEEVEHAYSVGSPGARSRCTCARSSRRARERGDRHRGRPDRHGCFVRYRHTGRAVHRRRIDHEYDDAAEARPGDSDARRRER